ncbi:MAG: hypothetical protein QXU32_06845 [Nitrososphaerales archaeon]
MNIDMYATLLRSCYYHHAMLCAQWLASSIVSRIMVEGCVVQRVSQTLPLLHDVLLVCSFEEVASFTSMYNDDVGEFISSPSRCIDVCIELCVVRDSGDDVVIARGSTMIWICRRARFVGYDILDVLCSKEFVESFINYLSGNNIHDVQRQPLTAANVAIPAYYDGYDNLD